MDRLDLKSNGSYKMVINQVNLVNQVNQDRFNQILPPGFRISSDNGYNLENWWYLLFLPISSGKLGGGRRRAEIQTDMIRLGSTGRRTASDRFFNYPLMQRSFHDYATKGGLLGSRCSGLSR
ncbi:hypothetical protein TNCT_380631 [Trichonephila clavata]|uniref:Uncharacterized protein n=1 Tax=Trichonephila clavata TaxID=2740835 RepID=A0A8X6K7H4_TRICU|nr:hypothetical protein TNCT_380631 [Trichonephila clavata]